MQKNTGHTTGALLSPEFAYTFTYGFKLCILVGPLTSLAFENLMHIQRINTETLHNIVMHSSTMTKSCSRLLDPLKTLQQSEDNIKRVCNDIDVSQQGGDHQLNAMQLFRIVCICNSSVIQ